MSPLHKLPRAGASYEEVTHQVDELLDGMTPEQSGKLSSTAFWGIGDALQIAKETHAKFFSWNALFTFQEGSAAKFENDVLDICIDLVGGDEQSRGNLTSGGTESNFCALHAMRNWAREHRSDITVARDRRTLFDPLHGAQNGQSAGHKSRHRPSAGRPVCRCCGNAGRHRPKHHRHCHFSTELALWMC